MSDAPRHRAESAPFHLSDADLQAELDHDRRTERRLWLQAAIAVLAVGLVICARLVFFS